MATPHVKDNDRDALKPCPFCGGRATVRWVRDGQVVRCECGAEGPPEFHGPTDIPNATDRAITSWNRRAALQASE